MRVRLTLIAEQQVRVGDAPVLFRGRRRTPTAGPRSLASPTYRVGLRAVTKITDDLDELLAL